MTSETKNSAKQNDGANEGSSSTVSSLNGSEILTDRSSTQIYDSMKSASDSQLYPITLQDGKDMIIPHRCRPEDVTLEQLEDDLAEMPLTEVQREMAEDLLKAIRGDKDGYIANSLSPVVEEHSENPDDFRAAADALNEVFGNYGIVGPIKIGGDGSLQIQALKIFPDGSWKIMYMNDPGFTRPHPRPELMDWNV